MKWNFWSKEENTGAVKLPKPQEMPQAIGMYLVTKLNQNPDMVWNYKVVLMPRDGSKTAFGVRVYNPSSANDKGVRVVNYASLDAAADLVLYQGTYDQQSGKVELS